LNKLSPFQLNDEAKNHFFNCSSTILCLNEILEYRISEASSFFSKIRYSND